MNIDKDVYARLIKSCHRASNFHQISRLHADMVRARVKPDLSTWNVVLHSCVKLSNWTGLEYVC